MKYLLLLICTVFSIGTKAQQASLSKTTWQISNYEEELITFQKVKLSDFRKKDNPFYGLHFEQGSAFYAGNSCEGLRGQYSIDKNNVLILESIDAYTEKGCEGEVILDGAYRFRINGDQLVLSLIEDYDGDEGEEEYEELAPEIVEEKVSKQSIDNAAANESEVDKPVKYRAFKIWTKAHLSNEFFRKQALSASQNLVVSLWIEENGKTKVTEISGTEDETLKQAIINELAKMPMWNKGEVDFNKTIKVPLRYQIGN